MIYCVSNHVRPKLVAVVPEVVNVDVRVNFSAFLVYPQQLLGSMILEGNCSEGEHDGDAVIS